MEQFQIETAQNVGVNQNIASIKDRIFAYVIDSFIRIVYLILFAFIIIKVEPTMSSNFILSIASIIYLPVMLYYLIFESMMNGKTVGKAVMKIKVAKLDGSKPTFANYFVRWVLRLFEISMASGSIAILTILFKGTGQRLGDLAANTTVISEKQQIKLEDTLLRELPDDYQPTFAQVTVFKDNEIQIIKNLYDKAIVTKDHKIINKLDQRIKQVTGITTELLPIQFIDIVIKDYNFYTQNS